MFFSIDPTNGLAIYDQIVRQVKYAIANEVLPPGKLVPSVRELAHSLAVNPNTVARAYRELQAEGILSAVRGTGLEVAEGAPPRCREDRVRLLRERLRSVVDEVKQSRLDAAAVRRLVDEELSRLETAPQGDSR